ncbi:MAG: N-acetylmuramoyl-L-alanine amidase [Phycisphaerales bacterium]|nr:MAG: N-acetylmuramoyl-L-alanine amidase [Phycisphaerales bacterium]
MFKKSLVVCTFLFIVSGCVYRDEPAPRIADSPVSSEPKLTKPRIVEPSPTRRRVAASVPRDWFPPANLEKKWKAIVVHHSATGNGNAAIFDKWHREGNHWDGVGYDFVIGNGTDSADGLVEVTFRWREQKTGAHCGGTPGNWANEDAVGICLVGDYNNTIPTARQMQSLAKLTRFLQRRYRIPASRIYGHNTTPGARTTDCPGRNFPMARFKSMVDG